MARLLLPGWHGSGPGHWQRLWLDHDPSARIVEQDDWAKPDRDAWLARLAAAIDEETEPATLVAHSLGTALVAHYAARFPTDRIGAALLVAPGDADLHAADNPELVTFAPVPRDRLPFPSVLVVSRNDKLMSYERAVELGNNWGARIVDAGNAGHINRDSGYGEWPEGLRLADELDRATAA